MSIGWLIFITVLFTILSAVFVYALLGLTGAWDDDNSDEKGI